MLSSVECLLKENQTELLSERRSVERKPFVRPVTIRAGREQDIVAFAFSRDISPVGIGLISQISWKERTRGSIEVLSTKRHECYVIYAEVRWTRVFGDNWYYTGWRFLEEDNT